MSLDSAVHGQNSKQMAVIVTPLEGLFPKICRTLQIAYRMNFQMKEWSPPNLHQQDLLPTSQTSPVSVHISTQTAASKIFLFRLVVIFLEQLSPYWESKKGRKPSSSGGCQAETSIKDLVLWKPGLEGTSKPCGNCERLWQPHHGCWGFQWWPCDTRSLPSGKDRFFPTATTGNVATTPLDEKLYLRNKICSFATSQ